MAVRPTGIQLEFISPANLLGLVRKTAPFLFETTPPPLADEVRLIDAGEDTRGFLQILQCSDRTMDVEDYFAFCLACHHATVATFVPTDVDSKIRGLLWREARGREPMRRMFEFTLRAMNWSIAGISTRYTELAGVGPVSGHNGEMLSVLAGALGSFLKIGDTELADRAAAAIDAELEREAVEFRFAVSKKGCELDVPRLAASLTHNAGDLDQGISFWPNGERHAAARRRFGRLAHENTKPCQGTYAHAARVYKKAMSPEGHRNYPLRAVKALRQSPDFLLPLGPFLDDWGARVAVHPALSDNDRAEVLAALLHGCRTIPNQRGYFRAIHGMSQALEGRIERIVGLMPSRARSDWKNAEFRKQIAFPRASFEAMMRKFAAG